MVAILGVEMEDLSYPLTIHQWVGSKITSMVTETKFFLRHLCRRTRELFSATSLGWAYKECLVFVVLGKPRVTRCFCELPDFSKCNSRKHHFLSTLCLSLVVDEWSGGWIEWREWCKWLMYWSGFSGRSVWMKLGVDWYYKLRFYVMLCALLRMWQILKYFFIAYLVYFVCHDFHLSIGLYNDAFLSFPGHFFKIMSCIELWKHLLS